MKIKSQHLLITSLQGKKLEYCSKNHTILTSREKLRSLVKCPTLKEEQRGKSEHKISGILNFFFLSCENQCGGCITWIRKGQRTNKIQVKFQSRIHTSDNLMTGYTFVLFLSFLSSFFVIALFSCSASLENFSPRFFLIVHWKENGPQIQIFYDIWINFQKIIDST